MYTSKSRQKLLDRLLILPSWLLRLLLLLLLLLIPTVAIVLLLIVGLLINGGVAILLLLLLLLLPVCSLLLVGTAVLAGELPLPEFISIHTVADYVPIGLE